MFFIIVDAHSKWLEVISMPATTAHHTIGALNTVFSHYGLPDMQEEFASFMKRSGFALHHTILLQTDLLNISNRPSIKRAMRAEEKE